jgi:hypothetical protein
MFFEDFYAGRVGLSETLELKSFLVVTRLLDLRAIKVVEVFVKVVRSLLESQGYLSNLSFANTVRDL